MARTAWRPTAKGELTNGWTLAFSVALCAAGSAMLYLWVNPLTMWLTFATFIGYAMVYTVLLKPSTPQNIVIGGASGAMPPVLGWAAMRGEVGPEALMLCLIIFLWTPPHFWALALYRVEDYRRSGLPMLPVTHGSEFTRLQVLLYTLVLFAATLLPFVTGMSGPIYLAAALMLGGDVLRLCLAAVARLFRPAGAPDLPLLHRPSGAAVRRAAGRPLPRSAAVNNRILPRRVRRGALFAASLAGRRAHSGSAGCDRLGLGDRPTTTFKGVDITGADYGARLDDDRYRRPAAQPGGLQGQGGGGLLRLHAVPGRVSDDDGRTGARSRGRSAPMASRLQGIFVTVDPERDTPQVLKTYMAQLRSELHRAARHAGADRCDREGFQGLLSPRCRARRDGSYTMDHTAGSYVFDPSGRLRLFVRYGGGAEALTSDLKALLAG